MIDLLGLGKRNTIYHIYCASINKVIILYTLIRAILTIILGYRNYLYSHFTDMETKTQNNLELWPHTGKLVFSVCYIHLIYPRFLLNQFRELGWYDSPTSFFRFCALILHFFPAIYLYIIVWEAGIKWYVNFVFHLKTI